jgi:hypothetical protein
MMERYYSQMGHDSRHGVVCHRMLNGDMHCLNEPTRPQRRSPLRASVGSLLKLQGSLYTCPGVSLLVGRRLVCLG